MVRAYFALQQTLMERLFREWRVAPWLVCTLGPLLFFGVGWWLIERSDYAIWIMIALSLSTLHPLSEGRRNDFLRGLYQEQTYRHIRLIENALVVFPFVLLLLLKGFWAGTLVQGLVGMVMVWRVHRGGGARALPTPFGRRPFEFAVGLRTNWWLIAVAVLLVFQGIRAGNYELTAFAAFLPVFTGMQCYATPEPGFYVWVYTLTAKTFLRRKLLTGLRQQVLLTTPLFLATLVAFSECWMITAGLFLLGLAYLTLAVVVKYACYPEVMDVGTAFIFGLGMIFFPVLPAIIPVYYRRALRQIQPVLPVSP